MAPGIGYGIADPLALKNQLKKAQPPPEKKPQGPGPQPGTQPAPVKTAPAPGNPPVKQGPPPTQSKPDSTHVPALVKACVEYLERKGKFEFL